MEGPGNAPSRKYRENSTKMEISNTGQKWQQRTGKGSLATNSLDQVRFHVKHITRHNNEKHETSTTRPQHSRATHSTVQRRQAQHIAQRTTMNYTFLKEVVFVCESAFVRGKFFHHSARTGYLHMASGVRTSFVMNTRSATWPHAVSEILFLKKKKSTAKPNTSLR